MAWSGIDTRRWVRVSFECNVIVRKGGTTLVFKTETEDISIGGISVILERAQLKQTPVELKLFLPDDFPPVECKGKIVWVTKRSQYVNKKSSQFNTGIEITEISEQDKARLRREIEELLKY